MAKNGCQISGARIGVLGITFKENCPDIRNSKIIDLIRELESWNTTVKVVDPWASADEVEEEFNLTLAQLDDLVNLDAIVVAVGHNQFRSMPVDMFVGLCRTKKTVFADLKGIYKKRDFAHHDFDLFRL